VRKNIRFLIAVVVACACGGSAPPVAKSASEPVVVGGSRRAAGESAASQPLAGGSSDGMTCEQARDQYVEEINVGGPGAAADLKAEDFAAVLNNGSYLGPCDVPSSSKVLICAAVQNGRAIGVTVLLDPPNPTTEICVAGQVRQLGFPTHAKMDVVNVTF
jgi:eukaryotic-like serine/threonine-protein kinase